MRIFMVYFRNSVGKSLLFLAFACLILGCDKPIAEPGAAQTSTENTAQSNTQANGDLEESTPDPKGTSALQHGSASTTDIGADRDTDTEQPASTEKPVKLELNAPSAESSSASQTAEVDHNDPTSYPVTEFVAKQAGQVMMFSWNVESDGAEADTICKELKELNANDRYDVVALTEVLPEDFKKFQSALGSHYEYAHTKSGRSDRMQILYNEDKFEKVRHFEIDEINIRKRYRAPLVVHLKERKTDERLSLIHI